MLDNSDAEFIAGTVQANDCHWDGQNAERDATLYNQHNQGYNVGTYSQANALARNSDAEIPADTAQANDDHWPRNNADNMHLYNSQYSQKVCISTDV